MTTIVMLPTPPAAQPARSAQPSRSGAPGAAADRDFARTLDEVSGRQDRAAHDDDAPADVPEDAPAADAAPVDGSDVRAHGTGARPDGDAARPDGESARPAALLLSIAQIVQSAAGALDAAAGSRPVDAAAVLAAGVPAADAQVSGTGGATVTTDAASADAEGALAPVIDLASRRAPHVPTQRGAGGRPGAAGAAGDATGVRPAVDPATLGAPLAPVLGADAPTGAPRLFAVEACRKALERLDYPNLAPALEYGTRLADGFSNAYWGACEAVGEELTLALGETGETENHLLQAVLYALHRGLAGC